MDFYSLRKRSRYNIAFSGRRKNLPMNIALWGYEYFGQELEKIINHSYSTEYQITCIFDKNALIIRNTGQYSYPVEKPDMIKDLYQRGLFEAVLISVEPSQRFDAELVLKAYGVPVLDLKRMEHFVDPKVFPREDTDLPFFQDGYELFVYRNQYLSMTPNPEVCFVTDLSGNVNAAYWYEYQKKIDIYAMYCRPVLRMPAEDLPGDWCCLTKLYASNYWHFTYDILDCVWLMERSGFKGQYLLFEASFTEELMTLAGVDPMRITWIQNLDQSKTYRFEKLFCPVLHKEDRFKSAAVLHETAAAIIRSIPYALNKYPERIFVKRVGRRKLIIPESFLKENGFITIVPEELSVAEQILFFNQAKIVLSPHGANSTNCLYMRPGSVLIETFPSNYTNPCCLETLISQGVSYLPLTAPTFSADRCELSTTTEYSIYPTLLDMTVQNAIYLSQ